MRLLAARQIDGRIQRGARNTDRDCGEAQSKRQIGGEFIQRASFTQRGGFVAECGEFFRDEQIVDRIAVGAGAVEADHVPDVVHRGARQRKQDGAYFRRAIGFAPRGAVGFDDPDMGAEPARLTGAAGEVPARGGAITAGNRLHLVGDRAPGENAGWCIENLVRRFGFEIGRRHGADRTLAQAPRRGGVGFCNFLQHLHEDFRRRLGATEALRQQHALDLIGLACDQRLKRSRALDEAEAGKFVHAFPRPLLGF